MKKEFLIVGIIFVLLAVSLSGCVNQNQTSDNKSNEKKSGGEEYMWSTMDEGPYRDKVSFATSTDLLNWNDSKNKKILAEHASVPGVIYKDGTIYVYFVDVSEDGIPEQTGLIRSTDKGQTWSSKEYVTFDGIGDKVPVDPAPFLLDNGSTRLYYFDINEGRTSFDGTNKIYSAISTDGMHFMQEDGIRFSRKDIFDPDVIEVNGTWRLYVGDIAGNMVISAKSTDGLNFVEEGTAYSSGAVPDVFFKDGTYYLYTAGINISTSQDGTHFSKTSYSFRSQQGMVTADPSVIELDDGTYMMLYKTKG